MSDLKPKFIIYDGEFLLGMVYLHEHLLPDKYDREKVCGGGYFKIDQDRKIVKVHGKSYDFGKFDEPKLLEAELPDQLKSYRIVIVND